jgi:uncharacterized damage-inducible protein DinB
MSPQPPLGPDERVASADERPLLEAFLDWHRSIVVAKVSGLDDEAVRRRHVQSSTTLAGVVQHLAGVERSWFLRVLDQRPPDQLPPNSAGDEDSWLLAYDRTVADVVSDYEDACEQSRTAAARHDLDATVPDPRLGQVSLRWIYVHMIEETARHVGHLDILRELTDGATGVDG